MMATLTDDFWMIWQREHRTLQEDLMAAIRYYTEKVGRLPHRVLLRLGVEATGAKAVAQGAGLEWLEAPFVQEHTLWLS